MVLGQCLSAPTKRLHEHRIVVKNAYLRLPSHKRHRNVLDTKREHKPCVEHTRAPLRARLPRTQDRLDLVVSQERREEADSLRRSKFAAYACAGTCSARGPAVGDDDHNKLPDGSAMMDFIEFGIVIVHLESAMRPVL